MADMTPKLLPTLEMPGADLDEVVDRLMSTQPHPADIRAVGYKQAILTMAVEEGFAAALRQTLARIAELEAALTNLRWEIDAPEVVAGDEFTYFAPRIRDAIAAAGAVLAALSPTTGAASEGERS